MDERLLTNLGVSEVIEIAEQYLKSRERDGVTHRNVTARWNLDGDHLWTVTYQVVLPGPMYVDGPGILYIDDSSGSVIADD
jgi:hypothetical protein